jgi:chlorobactene glucosyltransferase
MLKRWPSARRPDLLDMYNGAVFAGAVASSLVLAANLRALRRLRLDAFRPTARAACNWPVVSVLVPARNEAANIERCVRSLLAQDYPALEILVLDDGSTDGTYEIVEQVWAEDTSGRLRLIRGGDLPKGWMGKCYACQQLADQAQGDYLLFTDADTVHAPGAVAGAVAAAEQLDAALVTALPRQEARSFIERLFQPMLAYDVLTLLPIELVGRVAAPIVSAGNGQFLCFRRDAYDAIGGHAAVYDRVLEDMEIVRRLKAAKYRAVWLDGGKAVRCRMYRSFGDLWKGYSKNLFACYGSSVALTALGLSAWLSINALPPMLVGVGVARRAPRSHKVLPAATWALTIAMRLALARRVRAQSSDWLAAFFHPFAALLQAIMTLNSVRWSLTGRGISWKGRVYPGEKRPI